MKIRIPDTFQLGAILPFPAFFGVSIFPSLTRPDWFNHYIWGEEFPKDSALLGSSEVEGAK